MPRQYEHIKESELKAGKSLKEAKRIAAATYIKQGGDPKKLHHKKKRRHKSVGDNYVGTYY